MTWSPEDFLVSNLGERTVDARVLEGMKKFERGQFWVSDDEHVPYQMSFKLNETFSLERAFEKAGAREKIFFNPSQVTAGIVTCGGICPGLNDVIRALYMELYYTYGVRSVLGFRYGLQGLDPTSGLEPIHLYHDRVADIHMKAGTILGTSRGIPCAFEVMIDNLRQRGVNILFVVGGDGTQKAAHSLYEAAKRVNHQLAIVGVPKTIDNDINFVYKTFGFDTAVSFARQSLESAHIEARGHRYGIGMVKVMGRDSGFIAAYATLASINVNYCLIPEIPFDLEGKGGLLEHLAKRLERRDHAVIVVAEGAGQHLLKQANQELDASGNVKYGDIGLYMKERIEQYFKTHGMKINLKYFDPSYMLRSVPSNANDSIFASELARHAVHAAMAGKTDVMVGRRFNQYILVPIPMAVAKRKKIEPDSQIWSSVLQSTGQPAKFIAEK